MLQVTAGRGPAPGGGPVVRKTLKPHFSPRLDPLWGQPEGRGTGIIKKVLDGGAKAPPFQTHGEKSGLNQRGRLPFVETATLYPAFPVAVVRRRHPSIRSDRAGT